jgi:hypothetical protein
VRSWSPAARWCRAATAVMSSLTIVGPKQSEVSEPASEMTVARLNPSCSCSSRCGTLMMYCGSTPHASAQRVVGGRLWSSPPRPRRPLALQGAPGAGAAVSQPAWRCPSCPKLSRRSRRFAARSKSKLKPSFVQVVQAVQVDLVFPLLMFVGGGNWSRARARVVHRSCTGKIGSWYFYFGSCRDSNPQPYKQCSKNSQKQASNAQSKIVRSFQYFNES